MGTGICSVWGRLGCTVHRAQTSNWLQQCFLLRQLPGSPSVRPAPAQQGSLPSKGQGARWACTVEASEIQGFSPAGSRPPEGAEASSRSGPWPVPPAPLDWKSRGAGGSWNTDASPHTAGSAGNKPSWAHPHVLDLLGLHTPKMEACHLSRWPRCCPPGRWSPSESAASECVEQRTQLSQPTWESPTWAQGLSLFLPEFPDL